MTDTEVQQLIQFRNVTKQFGSLRALDSLSFDVRSGESVALWGSNGAGKTTLIRCLLGVTRFDGDVLVEGTSSKRRGKEVRQRIGYVPQLMPYFDLPVGEMVLLITRLRGATPREGLELLEQFSLAETRRNPVRSLSGGMRQKLALTLALLGNPALLVLDEPTANLDANTQKELLGMLNDLKRDGRTILFTSHRWSEVRALADSVVHLEKGKILERGSVSDLAPERDHVSIRFELASELIGRAESALRTAGFVPFTTESHITVAVQDRTKMDVFAVLQAEDIVPRNFDMEVDA